MRFERLYTKLFCRPLLLESATRVGFELALISLMEGGSFEQAAVNFEARKTDPKMADRRAGGILETRGRTAIIHIDGSIDKTFPPWTGFASTPRTWPTWTAPWRWRRTIPTSRTCCWPSTAPAAA